VDLLLFLLIILILNVTNCPNTQENSWRNIWDPRDTIIKMALIKQESEDIKIEEVFSVKQEDTEEQTG